MNDLVCGLVAVGGRLGEGTVDNGGVGRGDAGPERARRLVEDLADHRGGGGCGEGMMAAEHLVHDDAEGEDVGAAVGGLSVEDFRRHVLRGAGEHAGDGEHGGGFGQAGFVGGLLSQSEVEQFDLAGMRTGAGEHDVFRLDVAVEDALVVGGGEGGRGLRRDAAELVGRDGAGEAGTEGFSLDVLHDEVDFAVVSEDVVDGGDARMVERGGALAFMQEAPAVRIRGGALSALDSDEATEGGVAGAKDLAHAARAETGFDVEAAGEDAVDAGKQTGSRAQVMFERRRVLHCGFYLRWGFLS